MKNPIPYTKEDIYMIVEMAIDLDRGQRYFSNENIGFSVYRPHKKLVDELIFALSPEERENPSVKFYMKYIYKDGE